MINSLLFIASHLLQNKSQELYKTKEVSLSTSLPPPKHPNSILAQQAWKASLMATLPMRQPVKSHLHQSHKLL